MARRGILLLVTLALVGISTVPAEEAAPAAFLTTTGPEFAGPLDATTVSNGAEPLIHVTRDGTTILIGDHTGLYRSTNGGATWTRAPNPFVETPFVGFADGWAIAEDDAGRIYVADTNGPMVGVASSASKGASWDVQTKVVAVGSIVDRPWLAARGDGEVSLIVNSDRGEECYRSVDQGRTFLSFSHISNGRPNAGNVVYDTRGRLWFSNGDELWRWNNPCASAPLPIDHPNGGAQIFVQVDTDLQDRPYFAQPSSNNDAMELWALGPGGVFRSIKVSPTSLKSNTFGAIDVEKSTGDVAVAWYGSTTPGNPSVNSYSGSWHTYVARIKDFWGTPSITVTQVTSEYNHVGDFCMSGIGCTTGSGDRDLLDYMGVSFAPDGSIHVAYGHDGDGSNRQVRYAHVP